MKKMNFGRRICLLALSMTLLLGSLSGVCVTAAEETVALPPVSLSHSDRDYGWLSHTTDTYTYDFTSDDILTYSKDEKLASVSLRTNMIFANGKLACKEGKTFSLGSSMFLGDDYGIFGGELSFRLKQTGGRLAVGTRLEKAAADPSLVGVWFDLSPEGLSVQEPETGWSVSVPYTAPDAEVTVVIKDTVDQITLTVDGRLICTVSYGGLFTGALTVYDAEGRELGRAVGSAINPAGFFTLYADSLDGTIDDMTFSHVCITDTTALAGEHIIDYSTWVATDDRNRTTPTGEITGEVKSNKQVGLFYFLCWTGGDDSPYPRDITDRYLTLGLDGLKSFLENHDNAGGYYWAEPYFGYYKNTDSWVYRKHAYMLEAAGVDFIYLDMTNGATYPEGLMTLMDTWLEIRREGHHTPDICIFGGGSISADLNALRGNIFSEEGWKKYGEMFYQYDGKPLILANLNQASEADKAYLNEHFTVRGCWAWQDADNTWNWLQEYRILEDGSVEYVNGGPGRDANGNFEELALCVGHHPTTSKGRSYVNTVAPVVNDDFGFSLDSGAGTGFAGQFEAIQRLDPDLILITGWNEWTAGLQWGGEVVYAGTRVKGRYYMVDTFNTEYSRDAEPMRLRQGEQSVGFGDNYYYQMASIIRTFKGWDQVTEATGQGTVSLTDQTAWDNVGPDYRDSVGDTALRHAEGHFTNIMYVNNTGRNDFDTAKVSQDADYLYFTVSCVNDIVVDDGRNWMNLFINLDGDATTGWEGYDFVLNRARDSHYVAIESLADGWTGVPVGQALYTLSGNTMTVRVSKAALGISGELTSFLFKWADHSTLTGNVMEFMDLGDTAPNDRYAYLYHGTAGATQTVNYTLIAADGGRESLRDEATPLPGMEIPDVPETWQGTDPVTEPTTDAPVTADSQEVTRPESGEADLAPEPEGSGDAMLIGRHSVGLKVVILLTGAVTGVCGFLLITTIGAKKKHEDQSV